jgi:hypothetical protein
MLFDEHLAEVLLGPAPRRRDPLAKAVMDVPTLLQPPVTLQGISDGQRWSAITDVRLPHPVHMNRSSRSRHPFRMATGRAGEAARPSQPLEVFQAVCISREPSLKFPKGLRVVGPGVGTFHCRSLRSTPVKWTPQPCVIDAAYNGPAMCGFFPSRLQSNLVLPHSSRLPQS